jgi:uncharacterized protein (TIGR03437 family)
MRLLWLLLIGIAPVFAQSPSVSSVLNAASLDNRLSPGCIAVVNGSNLGFGNAVVLVGGVPAPVIIGGPAQISIQVPFEADPGRTSLVVQVYGRRSPPFSIKLTSYAPGLESVDYTGKGMGTFTFANGAFVTAATPATPSQEITLWATGLGATNPQIPSGTSNVAAQTASMPAVTVGGEPAKVTVSALSPVIFGYYQVNFVVPPDLPPGNAPVVLAMGDQASNTVVMPIGKANPLILSVVNSASFGAAGAVAPGELIAINGGNLGNQDKLNLYPSTSVEGISITLNQIPVPLFHLLPSVNRAYAIVPTEIPETGNGTLTITNAIGSAQFSVRRTAALPGIFRIQDPAKPSRFNALATFAGTAWRVVPSSMAEALSWPNNCKDGGIDPGTLCGQPATAGDNIQVYVTGLGKATPNGDPSGDPLATGQVAPPDGSILYMTLRQPLVTLGGVPTPVQFSGIAPGLAGIYVISFQIPTGAPSGDDVPLVVTIPGQGSDAATISIH